MKIEGEAAPEGQMTDAQMQDAWDTEAGILAGGDATGETTDPALDDPADEQVETPAAPAAPAPAPAAPSLEERLARAEQLVQQMSNQLGPTVGRVAAMQGKLDAAEAARKAGGDAPSKAAIATAAGDTKKWDQLKADFPEWAEGMEERMAAILSQQAVTPAPPPIDREALKADIRRDLELDQIAEKYPDWRATSQTNEFKNWFKSQTPEFQAKAESERGRDVIQVLDKFNEAKAKSVTDIRQSRQNKLDAAAGVATPGRPAPRVKDETEMTEDELWDLEARRGADRKKRQG